MTSSQTILDYIQALVWPITVIILTFRYHDLIQSLIPKSKISFSIPGITVETTLDKIEESIEENLRGRPLSKNQWEWLQKLDSQGRIAYPGQAEYKILSPLRNAGLIREYPEGYLTRANEIEITSLGRLLLKAYQKTEKSR